jgi:hypothetical protein
MEPRVFGYSYFGTPFREIVHIDDGGFVYKAQVEEKWSEVAGYRASPDFFPDRVLEAIRSAKPRLALYLRNGDVLKVQGDLLVRRGQPMRREHGIPIAFMDLVETLDTIGIPKWHGPREEAALFGTAGILMLVGFVIGVAVAARIGMMPFALGIGVGAASILAQAAFLISPTVAKRLRTTYLRRVADSRSSLRSAG